ncbi:MAG: transposase [Cyclobacteriaceae bacterium]|nr:transposase [Cyclobacteriaceae bacterium]
MSEKYKFNDPQGTYFVTSTVVGWVDLFTRRELKHIIIESLRFCQREKGLLIHAWCLMPSHLHMIISSDKDPLPDIMRDFKKFTSREIIKGVDTVFESRKDWILELFGDVADRLARVRNYKVWQDGNHPIQVISPKVIRQKMDYIHENPVVAEIVGEPEYYLYSSARDYYLNQQGFLAIDFL